jgi:acetyl-CoA acetyltransferase
MSAVAIRGMGITRFGKFPSRTMKDLVAEAVAAALKDASIEPSELQAVFSSNSLAGLLTGQESVRAQTVLAPLGLRGLPVVNVENACASGSTAFTMAVQAVRHGEARFAMALGFEKMAVGDTERTVAAIATGRDVEEAPGQSGEGWTFMAGYADKVRRYMAATGTTVEDFAAVAVKNRRHAALNPQAQYREPLTTVEILESRVVAAPLTQLMCAPITDGAAAIVVGPADATSPVVAATVLRSGSDPASEAVTAAARAAYEGAALGPEDIGVAEVHDAASPAELIAYEELMLAAPGEGAALLRSGATELGGRLPVNTSGGLVSRGHPIGATGLAMLHEIALQLRDEAGARQLERCISGLVYNAGGLVGDAPAAIAVHVLRKP